MATLIGLTSEYKQTITQNDGTLSAVCDGMAYGWTAPVLPILRNATTTPVQISETDAEWLEHIYMLGGFAGLPLTIYCVDKLGRKRTILLSSVQHLVAWTIIASTSTVELLYVARFLSGIAGDVAFVSAPMYIGEIADQRIRGTLGGIIFIMMLVGIVIIYSVAPFVSILASSLVGAGFALVQLLTFSFMPESPYFLLLKGKQADALKSLQRLRSDADVGKELQEISVAVDRQSSERGRPVDLLMVPSNRKALTIMLTLNAAQHFSSVSVMLMNLHTILADAAAVLPSSIAAIIFAVIMLVAASSATSVVDKVGRKVLLTSSSLLTGASLLALATYFAVKNSGIDITGCNWIPVAAVMVYAAAFKYGLGLIPIVLTAELFPTSVKAMGMTISDASYVVFGILSILLYQQLEKNFGMHWPFFVFSASCIFTSLFAILYIPETKGRTLEEIQYILKGQPLPVSNKNGKKYDSDLRINETIEDTVL